MTSESPDPGLPRRRLPILRSLKVKFVVALVLLVSVVIGFSTWWTLHVHRGHMIYATEAKARALVDAIERGLDAAMRDARHQDVQRIIERVGRDPDIDKVVIFDSAGKVLRATQPALVGRVLGRGRPSRYLDQPDFSVVEFDEDGTPVRSVVKKILNRSECFRCHGSEGKVNGILHLDISFRQTQEQIAQMEVTALWTMAITAAVLAIGGGILMAHLVERPVAGLIQAMGKVRDGDLEARAELRTRDELGLLAERFNTMVDQLKAARAEIEGYHQQRLARAERLATLGEMAASLAHEIKNPLAGIGGAVQVMADELPETDPRKEIMLEILTQVHRLDRTVQDLLSFARPGKPEFQSCDIHQILNRVLVLVADNPEAKLVRVIRTYQDNLPPLRADGDQLAQVFLNLVLNAIQVMPSGGQITLQTRALETRDPAGKESRAEPATVEIAITDTGPGIPSNLLNDIFTPFVTTKQRGTGLGLSVSRRIVEDHGGWIEAESPAGQGATFRVFLPLKPANQRAEDRLS